MKYFEMLKPPRKNYGEYSCVGKYELKFEISETLIIFGTSNMFM